MKKNINQTQKKGWLTLLAFVIIAFAVSIGFTPLFELIGDGIAARIIGSSFGAIFVIILTMFLLNKQLFQLMNTVVLQVKQKHWLTKKVDW